MSQNALSLPVTGTVSGLTEFETINAAIDSLNTMNSGAAAPANQASGSPSEGNPWLDTSAARRKKKLYDGASWLVLGQYDPSIHVWMPVVGGGNGTIASAATTDIGGAAESHLSITGTTTITSLGASGTPGMVKFLSFAASLTLTYNSASLILPTGANIVTEAGDSAVAECLSAGEWKISFYLRASGEPLSPLGATASLASASTADLGSTGSNVVSITGTTAITSFGASASLANPLYFVTFAGALTLTYNATSLILPTGANIAAQAGDSLVALYLGSGDWRVLSYQTASGQPLTPSTGNVAPWAITGGLPTAMSGNATTASITVSAATCADATQSFVMSYGGGTLTAAAGDAINGVKGGSPLANASTYHVYLCKGASGYGLYAVPNSAYPLAAASAPSGYNTYVRRLFSFLTTSAGAPIVYTAQEVAGGALKANLSSQATLDINNGGTSSYATSRTTFTVSAPLGIVVEYRGRMNLNNNGFHAIVTCLADADIAIAGSSPGSTAPLFDILSNYPGFIDVAVLTNTSAQIGIRCDGASPELYLQPTGWIDFRRS